MALLQTDSTASTGDGERWRTLRTIAFLIGIATTVFFAGMSWSRVDAAASRLNEIDVSFVKKDGRELAEIRGQLELLDQKIDLLLMERGIRR